MAEKVAEKMVNYFNERGREEGEEFVADDADWVEQDLLGLRVWTMNPVKVKARRDRRMERFQKRAEENGGEFNRPGLEEHYPAFAFVGNSLLISNSLQSLKAAISVDQGDEEALRDNSEYIEIQDGIRGMLKGELPSMINFNQPKEGFRFMAEMLSSDKTMDFLQARTEDMVEGNIVKRMNQKIQDNPLPDFETLEKYFLPNGSFIVDDETGFHILTFQKRLLEE